jgi:RNA polymerase sigma factor (sigma-70 family)
VSATGLRRGLSREIRELIEKVKASRKMLRPELDAILASLDPEHFTEELQQVVEQLDTVPLIRAASSHAPNVGPPLPGAGRISRRYLKEIDHFRAMTREEEVAAAKRLEFALERVHAAEFRSSSVRSARETEYDLLFNEFVERNLHIVVSEVYDYRTYSVPLDDLVQEGNAALMHAVEKFDWRKGVRFRTYVAWWIKQAVERHLAAQKGAVRVPHHLQQKLRRLKRQGVLPRGFDGNPSLGEVATAFDVDTEQAAHLVQSSRATYSLDQPIHDDDGDRYRDVLSETWEPSDSDRSQILRHRMRSLLSGLDERERTVLRLRFGLDGRKARTLEEIGTVLHLSRERSRQIQQHALGKLKLRVSKTSLEDEI